MTRPEAADESSSEPPPRVSVVVATYERRDKTLRCVASLVDQTLRDIEVIVVDDGSRDDTPDAVEASVRGRADVPVRVLRNGRNLGANASRNRGIAVARGDLVAFIDSDCIAYPDWLERIVVPFSDPAVGAVSGLVEDIRQDNVWELTLRGTHRLPRRGPVSRLVIGNACVRRQLLAGGALDESRPTRTAGPDGAPDIAISARSDEEGFNIALRAAGWKVLAEPSARTDHDHPYGFRSFLRQAYYGGCSASEIVWRHRLGPRRDLGPILAFHATWPPAAVLAGVGMPGWTLLPAVAGGLACIAIAYNELANKGKSAAELVRTVPSLLLYYHARAAGYVVRRLQLLLGIRPLRRLRRDELRGQVPPAPGYGGGSGPSFRKFP
jgi:glycosyltransferase involved in cell wall biosynthesis